MTDARTIQIVGGGLAGLTLGIGLRQRSVPVVVWEAGAYPRHRVCGEFISGRGLETLRRLGLLALVRAAGARIARTVAWAWRTKAFPARALPQPALCLSRFTLDHLLAEEFQRLGGELRCGVRREEKQFMEGTVRANGRRCQRAVSGWRWFGLKAHAIRVPVEADLEMHFVKDGYVGVSRLPDGKVNVCGLFRRRCGEPDSVSGQKARLSGEVGSVLCSRLASAQWDPESFCAVAGLCLQPRQAEPGGECCLGDALTMIPPITGNGMSMAFESAELAMDPLLAYARGQVPWESACRSIAERCDRAFAQRLRWARWLQAALLPESTRRVLLPLAWRSGALWRLLFWSTR